MKLFKIILIGIFALNSFLFSQTEHELNSNVPELIEFHEVIHEIWHTAWPEKNTELLSSLIPKIDSGYIKIKDAKLPGILRDKEEKWNSLLKEMANTIESYKTASTENNTQSLLDAAEKLHTNFEMMVRTIRPVLKEMDEFHKILYVLFHYNIADYNYEKVKNSVMELKTKAELLSKAELPERHKEKSEKFESSRKALLEKVDLLYNTVNKSDNKDEILKAVDEMHTAYENLESIF